ncbi:olfactory receptor 14J1-like [Zonotrichia albicollis]|uniref:olfactory receptor 14J1-like n=1 Tax=Zonotrichia albicollis TaxID=44394 RepID=UPI003D812591
MEYMDGGALSDVIHKTFLSEDHIAAISRELQLLHFCLLLGISLAALLGNGLIISAVACDHHLHTPMFFFLLNLGSRACAHMAAAAWACAFLNALMHMASTFSLPICHGNALGQFFCEIPEILKLSCSHSNLRELGLIAISSSSALGCFVFIVFSYVQIFRAVLRIPSEQGQHKAFSTCLPHLAVVSLFITTVIFAHMKPLSLSSQSLDLALSVLYSVVPPALNSLIYSLRNKELKAVVWRLMTGWFQEH